MKEACPRSASSQDQQVYWFSNRFLMCPLNYREQWQQICPICVSQPKTHAYTVLQHNSDFPLYSKNLFTFVYANNSLWMEIWGWGEMGCSCPFRIYISGNRYISGSFESELGPAGTMSWLLKMCLLNVVSSPLPIWEQHSCLNFLSCAYPSNMTATASYKGFSNTWR